MDCKPQSKIIQISSLSHYNHALLIALCEDGSLWRYSFINFMWTNIMDECDEAIRYRAENENK